jgi:NOL1/NOP2/fmu family ribosome biogenesis protein
MKETTQAKITASVAIAKAMAQKALAPNPNSQWTEYEMQSIDEWISGQDVKLDRPEAIRRLVELGLTAKREKT